MHLQADKAAAMGKVKRRGCSASPLFCAQRAERAKPNGELCSPVSTTGRRQRIRAIRHLQGPANYCIMSKLAVVTLPRCVTRLCRGAVAQLGERFNGIEEVRSSILLSSTIYMEARPREQGTGAERPLAQEWTGLYSAGG